MGEAVEISSCMTEERGTATRKHNGLVYLLSLSHMSGICIPGRVLGVLNASKNVLNASNVSNVSNVPNVPNVRDVWDVWREKMCVGLPRPPHLSRDI